MSLDGKHVLITGAARRIGRSIALAIAKAGGIVLVHYNESESEAQSLVETIAEQGGVAYILHANLAIPDQSTELIAEATRYGQLYALINNAAIFEALDWQTTSLEAWNRHLAINLTSPFLLCQAFARQLPASETGRIINLLDWRALRPGADHLPYTVSKAALAALTRALAISLAPNITVNGIALGAILPPADGSDTAPILKNMPVKRWAALEEVAQTILFLLDGPAYITGEIIHLDGGRHFV